MFKDIYKNNFKTIDEKMHRIDDGKFYSYPTNIKNSNIELLKDFKDESSLKRLGFGCNIAIKDEAIGSLGYQFYNFIERYPEFFIDMTPDDTATRIFPETIMGDFTTMAIENRRYNPSFDYAGYNDLSNGPEVSLQLILDYAPTVRLSTTIWKYNLQSMMSKRVYGYDEEGAIKEKTGYEGLRQVVDEIRFYGLETGNINEISAYNNVFRMYGLLNHPLLDNPIPATSFTEGGQLLTSWEDKQRYKQGALIWNDVTNLMKTLIKNTNGLASLPNTKIKIAMPPELYSCLYTLTSFENSTVIELINKQYPNVSIEQCVRLKDNEGVNWVYCTVDRIENKEYNNIVAYFGTTAKTFVSNYINYETKKTGIELSTGIAGFYPGHPKAIVRMNNI